MRLHESGDDDYEQQRLSGPHRGLIPIPVNELGGIVETAHVVVQTNNCAVQLELVRLFSTGLQFQIRALGRSSRINPRLDSRSAHQPGTDSENVQLKVAFPDGSVLDSKHSKPRATPQATGEYSLTAYSAFRTGTTSILQFWLEPVPQYSMVATVSVMATTVASAQFVITHNVIAEAALRVVELWPPVLY